MQETGNFLTAWKAYGEFLANLVPRVIICLFYFSVFVPFALGVRLFSDPLKMKSPLSSFWHARDTGDQSIADTLRQF